MKIKNIEVKSAVSVRPAVGVKIESLRTKETCEICGQELAEVRLQIGQDTPTEISFDAEVGPYCADKYLRAFA